MIWLACVVKGPIAELPEDTGLDTSPPVELVPAVEPSCPDEMAAVTSDGAIAYCIDRFEVVVEGELGSADQHEEAAVVATATATPIEGAVPALDVSYSQAEQVCANTPVLDRHGDEVGRKRLPTAEEWIDAADGVVGQGGTLYPYGDVYSASACPCPEGDESYSGPEQAGAWPDCVSAFGVYDQSGNLWEWVDGGDRVDHAGFWSAADGASLDVGQESGLLSGSGSVGPLELYVNGVDGETLAFVDGWLVVEVDGTSRGFGDEVGGYLALELEVTSWLAVTVEESGQLRVRDAWDGLPVAHKRGGAWYVGPCDLDPSILNLESHDYLGDIGFRCVADPVSETGSDR